MYINQKTEQEFSRFNKMPINKLTDLRRELDEGLFKNKFYLTGFNFPIPVQLNCLYLTRSQKSKLFSKSKIIIKAISKVVDEYYKSEELQKIVKIDPFEKKLFLNSLRPQGFGMMRLDAFWDGKNFKFVELNSDYPEGVVLFQNMCDAYNSIITQDKTKEYIDNKELFYDNLITLYKMNGGKKKKPTIAIVGPKNRLFTNEYELLREFFNKKGNKSFLIEPIEVNISKTGDLHYGKIKIDIIRRAGEIRYFKKQKNSKKIFNAYKNGKVQIINDFHNRLWGIKSVFAILHNKKFQNLFTKNELKIIKETIPETYIVTSMANSNEKAKYWNQKNNFVLKPADTSEGEDILFGEKLSTKQWHKLLMSKKCIGWIVQKKVKLRKRKILVVKNNKKIIKNVFTDFIIHTFMGKDGKIIFGNMGNRTSESDIVNVAKGGGVNQVKILSN